VLENASKKGIRKDGGGVFIAERMKLYNTNQAMIFNVPKTSIIMPAKNTSGELAFLFILFGLMNKMSHNVC
jgi:hypothetical protein